MILGWNLLGVIPAPTKNAGSTTELSPAKARQGNCREEALVRGLVHLSAVDLSWKQWGPSYQELPFHLWVWKMLDCAMDAHIIWEILWE